MSGYQEEKEISPSSFNEKSADTIAEPKSAVETNGYSETKGTNNQLEQTQTHTTEGGKKTKTTRKRKTKK